MTESLLEDRLGGRDIVWFVHFPLPLPYHDMGTKLEPSHIIC